MDQGRSEPAPGPSATRLALGLFLAFFTAQSAFVVLAPTLSDVADDFGVSVGTAGQLRTASAVAGIAVAALLVPYAKRFTLRALLLFSLSMLSAGAIASALAPTFALLAFGQVIVGIGGASLLASGLAAAATWPAPGDRSKVLAWAIVGQPASWVAGMPLIGLLAGLDWRWGWLLVPASAAAAYVALPSAAARRTARAAQPQEPATCTRSAWRDPAVRGWAFAELMAYAGWGGTLVYVGALFADTYNLGVDTVGILLGISAIAYFPGTFAVRRHLESDLRPLLAALAVGLAVMIAIFGLVRPSVFVSMLIFTALVPLAGARGIAGSAFGLRSAPEHKVAIGSIRSGAMQLGYLMGAAGGGIAVDTAGYPAVGLTLAAYFAAGALPYLGIADRRAVRRARRALAPIYRNWARGDWRAPQPQFAWGFSPEFPGSDGVRPDPGTRSERFAEWLRPWSEWRVEPERFVAVPCGVLVETRYRGIGKSSGVAVDTPGAHVWRLENGEPVALEVFADRENALRDGCGPCGGLA